MKALERLMPFMAFMAARDRERHERERRNPGDEDAPLL
jgi:hypothetical protein